MAQTFNLPSIGDAMVEGEIVEWFVAVGDSVDLDQAICSIETDKSVVELTTPYRGTVLALGAGRGDVVAVGSPLLVVGSADETIATSQPTPAPASAAPVHDASSSPGPASPATPVELASPLLRRLATELGVDVGAVRGTGHGGRVTRTDIETAAQPATAPTPAPAPTTPSTGASPRGPIRAMPKVRKAARDASIDLRTVQGSGHDGTIVLDDLAAATPRGEHREHLSAMRRAIARHLTESVQTIPQFTSMVEVDATALLDTRAALRDRSTGPVPLDAVVLALLIPVLRDHPVVNAYLDAATDEIVYTDRFDIGVAVDTAEGLIVPVVTNAAHRTVGDLGAEIVRLAEAARNRTIQPHELSGATCTLNNVGAVGIELGTPILPMGTSAIIAIGATRPRVALRDGNPVEYPSVTISATFDHRIIDGGAAGRFLTQLRQHLEVPALGLL